YLAQQAVEKAIKGFLVFHGVKVTKTHVVADLLEKLAGVDQKLANSISTASDLTIFALKYRYPEAVARELSRADVQRAVSLAKSVCAKILKVLEDPSHR